MSITECVAMTSLQLVERFMVRCSCCIITSVLLCTKCAFSEHNQAVSYRLISLLL